MVWHSTCGFIVEPPVIWMYLCHLFLVYRIVKDFSGIFEGGYLVTLACAALLVVRIFLRCSNTDKRNQLSLPRIAGVLVSECVHSLQNCVSQKWQATRSFLFVEM